MTSFYTELEFLYLSPGSGVSIFHTTNLTQTEVVPARVYVSCRHQHKKQITPLVYLEAAITRRSNNFQ